MEIENWIKLKSYIKSELADAEDNYESIIEKQLKLILEYMDMLEEKGKCKQV